MQSGPLRVDLFRFLPEQLRAAAEICHAYDVSAATCARIRIQDIQEASITLAGRSQPLDLLSTYTDTSHDTRKWLLRQRDLGEPSTPVFTRLVPVAAADLRLQLAMREACDLAAQATAQSAVPGARLPDFLVLGAPRCATTWLYDALQRHPGIHLGLEKEPEFFTDNRYHIGISSYAAQWAGARPSQLAGDVSVGYLHAPLAPTRVAATLPPGSKFIVLLREPIERALSYFQYRLQHRIGPHDFAQAIACAEYRDMFIEQGKYALDIERWFEKFPRSQFFFILQEDVAERPSETLHRLLTFLGADPTQLTSHPVETVNAGRWVAFPRAYQALRHFEVAALARGGAAAKPLIRASDFARRMMLSEQTTRPVLGSDLRAKLAAEFRAHTAHLEQLIGRDLRSWYP